MKNPALGFALVLLAIGIAGCSTITVKHDYDKSVDFSPYQTWAWNPKRGYLGSDPRLNNSLMSRRIENAVERELTAKGFRKASSGSADFLVGYAGAVNQKLTATVIDNYWGYPPYAGSYGGYYGGRGGYYYPWGPPVQDVIISQYEQGTLVLDIVDRRTKSLAWRGGAQAELRTNPTPEQTDQRVNEAVQRMLAKFPPR